MANETPAAEATLITTPDVAAKVDAKAPDEKVVDTKAAAPKDAPKVEGDKAVEPTAKAVEEKAAADLLAKNLAALQLKLPDGFDPKDAGIAEFKKLMATHGLDSAKAQSIFDLYASQSKAALAANEKSVVEKLASENASNRTKWVAAVKADPEIGGDKFDASIKAARQVFVKYQSPELKQLLEQTGWGDHPEMVKLFARIGKDLGEDTVDRRSGDAPPAAKAGATDFKKLFPNSKELWA